MNGQLLIKIENLEKELKEIKAQFRKKSKTSRKVKYKKRAPLSLIEIAERLKPIGKKITQKEVADEIAAYRSER